MILLNEREKLHGKFETTSDISQQLKSVIHREILSRPPQEQQLTNVQRESLDLICTKIARIVSGKSNCLDHWRDISGYAELACREIERSTVNPVKEGFNIQC